MALLESGEMYLETIYVLSLQSSSVRSIDVAEHLGYSKPSVSRAVGLLKKDGLLGMDEMGYLKLTEAGEDPFKFVLVEFHPAVVFVEFLIIVVMPAGFADCGFHPSNPPPVCRARSVYPNTTSVCSQGRSKSKRPK